MGFKMNGWSAFKKDIKMYDGNGEETTVDDSKLGKVYMDENGNKARDYTYTNKDGEKGVDVLYLSKPRGKSPWEGKAPTFPTPPIKQKGGLA